MDSDLQRGILLVVTILIVISFTLGLWTENGEATGGSSISPLIVFGS